MSNTSSLLAGLSSGEMSNTSSLWAGGSEQHEQLAGRTVVGTCVQTYAQCRAHQNARPLEFNNLGHELNQRRIVFSGPKSHPSIEALSVHTKHKGASTTDIDLPYVKEAVSMDVTNDNGNDSDKEKDCRKFGA